jgi:hypothetical protein
MSKKFIAIGGPRPSATPDATAPLMVEEIEAVWRDYAGGLIREVYERVDRRGVVMICEAEGRSDVEEMLAGLPLAKAGLLDTQVIELKPCTLWQTLFSRTVTQT